MFTAKTIVVCASTSCFVITFTKNTKYPRQALNRSTCDCFYFDPDHAVLDALSRLSKINEVKCNVKAFCGFARIFYVVVLSERIDNTSIQDRLHSLSKVQTSLFAGLFPAHFSYYLAFCTHCGPIKLV